MINIDPMGKRDINVEKWGWYSILITLILAIINILINSASGGLAVKAEMYHCLIDLVVAVAVLIGIMLSKKKSSSFPYGLHKVENIVSVFLAGMVFFTAYQICHEALFAQSEAVSVEPWMLVAVIVSIAIPQIFSYFELHAGKASGSPILIAQAKELQVHILTSGMVFITLLTQKLDLPLDRIGALIIALPIAKTGWDLLVDGVRVLLDASLDTEMLSDIYQLIEEDELVENTKWVTGRRSGRYCFIEANINLRVHELAEADRIVHQIESRVLQSFPQIIQILIHADPIQCNNLKIAAPIEHESGHISGLFGNAKHFAFITKNFATGEIGEHLELLNPYHNVEKKKGIIVAEWLEKMDVDIVVVKKAMNGRGPFLYLKQAGIKVIETRTKTVEDTLIEIDQINYLDQ
jgi:cation diffusion facilitator family transporter